MKRKSELKVSKQSIDEGQPGEPTYCPIALEIHHHYNKQGFAVNGTYVDTEVIEFTLHKDVRHDGVHESYEYSVSIPTPKKAAKFIMAFDNEQPVKPIKLWMPV